jgi:hypothetical protein
MRRARKRENKERKPQEPSLSLSRIKNRPLIVSYALGKFVWMQTEYLFLFSAPRTPRIIYPVARRSLGGRWRQKINIRRRQLLDGILIRVRASEQNESQKE